VLKRSFLSVCLILSDAVLFAQATPSASKNDEQSKRKAADAHPVFEVVTIKPSQPGDRLRWWGEKGRHVFMNNARVVDLPEIGYELHPKMIVGGPEASAR
jgi:hypothetical protein